MKKRLILKDSHKSLCSMGLQCKYCLKSITASLFYAFEDTYCHAPCLFSAIKEFQRAQNIDGNNQRAQEGVNKAQKLLKQSQKRDYYKILGVKR